MLQRLFKSLSVCLIMLLLLSGCKKADNSTGSVANSNSEGQQQNNETSVIKTYDIKSNGDNDMVLFWGYTEHIDITDVKLYFSENSNLKDAVVYDVDIGFPTYTITDFLHDKDYFWCVEVTKSNGDVEKSLISKAHLPSPEGPTVIEIEGVKNVRDIGGIVAQNGARIKIGLIYRAGEMDSASAVNITANGIKYAVENLKIKTDLDLRRPDQTPNSNKSPLGNDVKYINLSAKEYYEFMRGNTNEGEIMRIFADINNYPIILHCVYGADRTGTVAYLLEALLGVNEEKRIKDYEMTSFRKSDYSGFKALTAGMQKKAVGSTDQEKAYNLFSETFGLTEMEISNIYNILMTDSAIFSENSLKGANKTGDNQYQFNLILRQSKSVKSIRYNNRDVKFALKDGRIILNDVVTVNNGIGVITFDDSSVLRFEL